MNSSLLGLDKYQPSRVLVENNTGSAIAPLTAVALNGVGTTYPQVILGNPMSGPIFGITTAGIPAGGIGLVTVIGISTNINTSSWTESAYLYSEANGSLSMTPATAGDAPIAIVVKVDPIDGMLYIIAVGSQYHGSGSSGSEVSSVNGRTGAVTLNSSDVGLGNVNNTSDANKPVSTATQAALNALVQTVNGRAGAVTLTSADVGLGNVNNTSDLNKPISTATQTALNNKMNLVVPANSHEIWVSSGFGNDSTGDGSLGNPYLTVGKAIAIATAANPTSVNPYAIMLMAGRYDGETANILIPPWTWIVGRNYQSGYIKVNNGSGYVGLSSGWANGGARGGLVNCYLGGGTSFNANLATIGGSGTPSADVQLFATYVTGSMQILGRVQDIDFCEIYNCYFFGAATFDSGSFNVVGAQFASTMALSSNIANSSSTFMGCQFIGNVAITQTGSFTNSIQLIGTVSNGTLSATGSGVTLLADLASTPVAARLSIASGAVFSGSNDASSVLYMPTTSANWPTIPTTVQQALDLLVQNPPYYELHVFTQYTGSVQNGTSQHPYTTLQAAINAAAVQGIANSIIFLHDNPTENVVINNSVNGLTIQAYATSAKDSQSIKLTGNVTISGTSTRIRLKDFKIMSTSGPDLVDSSQGRNYFSNVDFGSGNGIQYTGSWARWHEYVDCTINGNVSITGSPSAGSQVSMWRVRGAPTFTLNSSNVTLLLVDSENTGTITQTNGSIIIQGGVGFVSGSTITSTANTPDTLTIDNASLQISGSTFAQINKTGTASYSISNVWRNESGDVLTGTRLVYGATATDQSYLPTTPANWPTVPTNVRDALDYLAVKPIQLINLTTSQRNLLTATSGMVIFNTDTSTFQGYNGSSWITL